MKTVSKILLIFAAALPAFAAAPVWDSTGNGLLNGTYYFRQVIYQSSGGSLSGAYSYYGNISFTGTGTYTVTSGTLIESSGQNGSLTPSGTYSVSSSGYGFMSSPVLSGANIVFLVSNGILVGSETENGAVSGGYINDMFVAAPYSSSLSLSSLSGTYTISSMFPNSDATYQLSPSGGSLGNVSISGYSTSGAVVTQNSSGVKYTFSNGAYSISFPTNTSANFYTGGTPTNSAPFNTGVLFLYSSPDSNFVFGGTQYGFDMFVGVRNASGGATTPFSGLYYEAGIDNNAALGLDSYYGTFNVLQGGSIIGHERLLSAGFSPEGFTYYNNYTPGFTGTYTDSSQSVNYTVSSTGIRIGYGTAGYPAIEVGLPYTPPAVSRSVYLDPTGIVSSASSAPYTAGISPGDFVTLYNGVNLSSTTLVATGGQTFPTNLGNNVTVIIDGVINAPLYYVSTSQISFIVPFEVSAYPIASIQVNNNGTLSNIATTYVSLTTPGVFTAAPEGGDGIAAMVDYPSSGSPFIVTANKPANPGDTVALYLAGLGLPFPNNVPDGAPGPSDSVQQPITVSVGGVSVGTPAYLGLAPGEPGLYQTNFTIPALCTTSGQTGCVIAGQNTIGIAGPDSYSDESYIPVSTGGTTALRTSQSLPDVTSAKDTSVVRKILPRLSGTGNR